MSSINSILLNDNRLIPQLGFGVWQVSDDDAEEVVAQALDVGYRLIDTAAIYRNEEGVGRAIARMKVPRDELFVTTKLWNDDQGYQKAHDALELSLRKLGLDYVDLYLIHWPSPQRELYVETWQALVDMKREGKIRSIGVSNFTPLHLATIINHTREVPVLNQVELHPRFQQRELNAFHKTHDIKTECWSPLGQGKILADARLLSIADKHGKTTAQIVIRWHVEKGFIVIPKSVTPARIKENFDVFNFTLDVEDIAAIDRLDSRFGRIGPHPCQTDF